MLSYFTHVFNEKSGRRNLSLFFLKKRVSSLSHRETLSLLTDTNEKKGQKIMSKKEIIRKNKTTTKVSARMNRRDNKLCFLSLSRKFLKNFSLKNSSLLVHSDERSQSGGGIIKPNQPMVCFGYSKNSAKNWLIITKWDGLKMNSKLRNEGTGMSEQGWYLTKKK